MAENQLNLFEVKKTYSLVGLRDLCLKETKENYKQVDGEDFDEFEKELHDEADLLFAERLRQIADEIEKRILEPQSQMIKETYGNIFKIK